jgi:hypothetical protein
MNNQYPLISLNKSEFAMTKEKTQNIKRIAFSIGLNEVTEPHKNTTNSTLVKKGSEQWL